MQVDEQFTRIIGRAALRVGDLGPVRPPAYDGAFALVPAGPFVSLVVPSGTRAARSLTGVHRVLTPPDVCEEPSAASSLELIVRSSGAPAQRQARAAEGRSRGAAGGARKRLRGALTWGEYGPLTVVKGPSPA